MGGKTKSQLAKQVQELKRENQSLRKSRSGNTVATILVELIRWAGLCLIAYFAYRSVSALAGKSTMADVGVNLDIRIRDVVLIISAVWGVGYGKRQQTLRKNTVERLQRRIRGFERQLDPHRTSSGLTPQGDTHPEDLP